MYIDLYMNSLLATVFLNELDLMCLQAAFYTHLNGFISFLKPIILFDINHLFTHSCMVSRIAI